MTGRTGSEPPTAAGSGRAAAGGARRFLIGWRQVLACTILMAVGTATITSAFTVIAVPLARAFHPSRMVLMLAMTVLALVSGLLSPVLGRMMDRTSLRRLMAAGAALLVVGYVALALAGSFAQVLLVYALVMAPANILVGTVATQVLISRWFVRRRGAALAIAISGISLGGVVIPPIVQALLDHFAWRTAFLLLAGIIALFTFPAVAMIVDRPADRGLHPDGADLDPEALAAHADGTNPSTAALLRDRTFWYIVAVLCVVLGGQKGLLTNVVPLALDHGVSAPAAALLVSIFSGAGLLGKAAFMALGDRAGLRVMLYVSIAGTAAGMAGMACLTPANAGFPLIAASVALTGLFGSLMMPMEGMLVAQAYGRGRIGQIAGLLNMIVLTVSLGVPPLFGRTYDLTGSYRPVFVGLVALSLLTLLLVPRIRFRFGAGRDADAAEAASAAIVALPLRAPATGLGGD